MFYPINDKSKNPILQIVKLDLEYFYNNLSLLQDANKIVVKLFQHHIPLTHGIKKKLILNGAANMTGYHTIQKIKNSINYKDRNNKVKRTLK